MGASVPVAPPPASGRRRDVGPKPQKDATVSASVGLAQPEIVTKIHAAVPSTSGKPLRAGVLGRAALATADIHVCFCSDDPDLRPLAVAINSTLAHVKTEEVIFHVVTSEEAAPLYSIGLGKVLPHAQIMVHFDGRIQARIQSLVEFRGSSGS